MTRSPKKNVAASVSQRLLNLSKQRQENFSFILNRYGVERLLYRLSCSELREKLLLKGSMVFLIWGKTRHRPTQDVDFLGFVPNDLKILENHFKTLCMMPVTEDGLQFLENTVTATTIQIDKKYQGVRITLTAKLGQARIPMRVDIGFGDVVTPPAESVEFPTLLEDFPAPLLRVYPKYTLVAEKFEALVKLGIVNTRLKDFYDLWILSQESNFEGLLLSQAIKNTFDNRSTTLPSRTPPALTQEFVKGTDKQKQWEAFLNKNRLSLDHTLGKIIETLGKFLMPPTWQQNKGKPFQNSGYR